MLNNVFRVQMIDVKLFQDVTCYNEKGNLAWNRSGFPNDGGL